MQVLIVAREPVIAALLGMLLELDDFEPVYAAPGERPEDALRRAHRPRVIVLDGELEAARSDLFHARALAAHARVVLFGEPFAPADVRSLAAEHRVPFFGMPVDLATLAAIVRDAAAT